MSLRPRTLKARGDTIIEVMIVLAVLGMAIGISYATANRSLLNARQAQENAQATELVQSQVEQLLTLASITDATDPNYIYKPNSLFCLVNNSGTVTIVRGFSSSDPLASYPGGYPNPACVNSFYHISINYTPVNAGNPNDPNADVFTVEAIWDDVLGQGHDTVTFTYKVHPPL